jgi:S-adenosylhomocysteine hydrolase
MIVRYVVADDAECDFGRIRSILNSGQPFFSLTLPIRLSLNGLQTMDATPPSADAIRKFLAARLTGTPNHAETLLITSREISDWTSLRSPDAFQIVTATGLTAISNYRSSLSDKAADLAFARRILHSIMRRCVRFAVDDLGCVCGGGNDFVYLSRQAERKLKDLDYRDGIRDLLQFINWLNQAQGNPAQPVLIKPRGSGLPLVEYFAQRILKEEGPPFAGKVVLMVLHFLSDLVPFVQNVIRLGAQPQDIYLVAKPYPYPARDKIHHELELVGVQPRRASERHDVSKTAADVLAELHQRDDIFTKKHLIVMEDGGYFAPLLHLSKHRRLRKRCLGIVEQTSKGIWSTERQIGKKNIKVPILSVARSSFKERYESPEIGRVTVQNISRFVSNVKLSGRRAVVFGFGSIGMHVAENLNRSFNMGVSVVDKDAEKRLLANHRKDIVTEATATFSQLTHKSETRLVVGTTGGGENGKPSVTVTLMKDFPDETILVSTSSDRIEFDIAGLKKIAFRVDDIEDGNTKYTIEVNGKRKTLFLLAEGYPINFYGSDSVPNETIDPIMALLLLSAVGICQNPKRFRTKIDVDVVDKIMGSKERKLAAEYSRLSERRN